MSPDKSTLYVADLGNNSIRRIDVASQTVSTIAGAGVASPQGVSSGPDGTVYVADTGHNKILTISPSGVTTAVAGAGTAGATDGTAKTATFQLANRGGGGRQRINPCGGQEQH